MKKLIAATALAGMVLAGSTAAATAAPAPKDRADRGAMARMGHRRALPRHALGIAAETIGVSRADLRSQLRDGKTVAEIAQANDVEPQAVVDAIVTAANERIDKAVVEGKITAERAAAAKARVPELARKLVDHEFDGSRRRHGNARRAVMKTAADAIGVSTGDLVREVRDGKTIAQVAEANDVEPAAVVDALVARVSDRLDRALDNGRIDEEKAEEITGRARERLTKLVNETPHRAGGREGNADSGR